MKMRISEHENSAMRSLVTMKLKFIFGVVILLSFIGGPIKSQKLNGDSSANVVEVIPPAFAISLQGKQPLPVAERAFLLSDLHTNDALEIFQAPPCLNGKYYVAFQLYYDLGDHRTADDWSVALSLTLRHEDRSMWTKMLMVDMKNQTFIATVFHDQPISCDQNYEVVLNDIKALSHAPKENIYLKFCLYRYDDKPFDPKANLTLNVDHSNHQTKLNWNYEGTSVLDYEIEWTFIDKYDAFADMNAKDAFLFSKAVRVSTPSVLYTHSVKYPSGKLWYRVRAIGYNPDVPEHRISGKWFYAENPVNVESPAAPMWQRSMEFSESGQYKSSITYFDGTLRERQVQAGASLSQSLITTKMYDFEGRHSVSTLAVPVGFGDQEFVSKLNSFVAKDDRVASQTNGARLKFHYDNDEIKNSILSTANGAGKYYSPANDTPSFHKNYIPNSDGYAYNQKEYSHDGYDIKVKESMCGEKFQIDGEHVIRDFRGTVAAEELIRLFGNYAHQANGFKKYLSVDASGQASVEYRNQQNRVVATALAGGVPSGHSPIESLTNLSSDSVTIGISDRNVITEGVSRTQHTILNVSPNISYAFRYDLSSYAATVGDACQNCVFDLQIVIVDPHGHAVNLAELTGNESTKGFSYERKNLKASECLASSPLSTVTFTLQLSEVGDYTVTKSLTPHVLTHRELQNLVSQNPQVQKEIQEIRERYVNMSSPCTLCIPLGDDSEAAGNEAMQEATDLEHDNVYQQIVQYYKIKYGIEYTVPDDSIKNNFLYCHYQLLLKNRESSLFEKQITQVNDWNEAIKKGYTKLIDIDPFFNNPAMSGSSSKEVMQKELDNLHVAALKIDSNDDGIVDRTIEYKGKLEEITDPSNVNYFIMPDGSNTQHGFHLLYAGLLERKNSLSTSQYEQEVGVLRWTLFRNYYMATKSKVTRSIQEYQNCPAAVQSLTQDSTTRPVDEMQANVNNIELDRIMSEVMFSCNKTFSASDSIDIRNAFEGYFNYTPGNFLRAIVRADIASNANLKAVQSILNGYGCGLDEVAQDGPLMCLKDLMPQMLNEEESEHQRMLTTDQVTDAAQDTVQQQSLAGSHARSASLDEPQVTAATTQTTSTEVMQADAIRSDNSSLTVPNNRVMKKDGNTKALPSRKEYNALIALYNNLGGKEWKHSEGWTQAHPAKIQDVSSWHGVTTDAVGHVIILNLENNNLTGEIPKEIGDLAHLQYLSFGAVNKGANNNLTGTIPSTIGNLQALRYVDLSYNQLTGAIPIELYKLKALQHLDLSFNLLAESLANEIGDLVNLSVLNLSHNKLNRTLPTGLGKLSELIQLYLSNNKLYGSIPSSIGNLSKLQHLDLSNNGFNGALPTTIGNLRELRYLRINNNYLNNSMPTEIGNLVNLKQLDLSVNRLSGSVPASIGDLTNLQHIVLSGNQLEGSLPGSLKNLHTLLSLSFSGNRLSGTIPDQIFSLENIQYIDLSMNELTGALSGSISYGKVLQKLFLSDNHLSGQIPEAIGSLEALAELSLNQNQFNGPLPASIGKLTKLESLHLSGNKLTGKIPKEIRQLTMLEDLVLSNNQFSDTIPSEIGSLTKLKKLNLSNNKLVGPIPVAFGKLTNLSELTLDDNKLTGTIPSSLGTLKHLTRVVLLNNNLEGAIVKRDRSNASSQDEALWLSHNRFTFANLQPLVADLKSSSFFFSDQDSVDVEKIVPATVGAPVTLTAIIDRGVIPACHYQWFKYVDGINDSTLNSASTEGHTYTLSQIKPSSFSSQYYYKITNAQVPSLTLISNRQTVMAFRSQDLCSSYQVTSQGISSFKFQVSWNAELQRCKENVNRQDSIFKAFTIGRFVEKEAIRLFKSYQSNCMRRVKERFEYTFTPQEYHYTLYFYDQAGNKIQVVAPQEVRVLSAAQINAVKKGDVVKPDYRFVTQYSYNTIGKSVSTVTRGGRTMNIYNAVGQLKVSQTSQQHLDLKYAYYRYNQVGRMIEVGEMTSKKNIKAIAALAEDSSFPSKDQFILDNISTTYFGSTDTIASPSFIQENVQNRIAQRRTISGTDTVRTYYSYDAGGNTKALLQQTPGLEDKLTTYLYDQGSRQLNSVFFQYGKTDQLLQCYSYNSDRSLKSATSSTDGFIWNQEARYYYYAHGPVARVELGEYRIQGQDYYHTLQGWMKGLNIPTEGNSADGTNTGRDVFFYDVAYFKDDYHPIKGGLDLPEDKSDIWTHYKANYRTLGLYNGLVSWTTSGDLKKSQTVLYQYDQLARPVHAKELSTRTSENFVWNESFGLRSTQRKGQGKTDSTTFSYGRESVGASEIKGSHLKYNANGNLIEDEGNGIKINWTMDGRVRKIERGDSLTIRYVYDGQGNCVQKIIDKNKVIFTTSYVFGLDTRPIAIYDRNILELLLYGKERLGRYVGKTSVGSQTLGNRQYEVNDHNHSVRMVISDNVGLSGSDARATQIAASNYYTSGFQQSSEIKNKSASYRFGFVGLEKEIVGLDYYFDRGQLYNSLYADLININRGE